MSNAQRGPSWEYEYDVVTGGFRVFIGAVLLSVCTENPLEDAAMLCDNLRDVAQYASVVA